MYPEQFFQTIHQKIKPQWRFAFLSAFITGFLVHFYRFANHLLTWDSVYNFHDSQNTIHLGRCFLSLGCGISSYYDLQWIIGLLSLLYLSLVCVCLTEIFSLEKKSSIFLLSALTVVFPSVASTFAYMYTADGYFLAMLLMTLSVLLTLRYQKGWLAGLFLTALGYGCYQAYISYTVMLILTWTVLQLLFQKQSVKKVLVCWAHFFLMGGLGTALYLVCNKVLSLLEGVSASDYNGIASMSLPGGSEFIHAVQNCIIDFVYFFFGPLDKINLFKILNAVLLVFLAVMILWLLVHNRLSRGNAKSRPDDTIYPISFLEKHGRFFMLLLCFAAMPFVCSMIYFLSPDVRYYMLMYTGFSLIYMLPVLLYEYMTSMSSIPYKAMLSWLCTLLTALTVFNFALIDNISYLYMTTGNAKTFALTGRMVDRIEQLEHFNDAKKLCIIGHFEDFDTISLNLPPAMAGIRDSYLISEQAHFAAMMDTYFGLSLENCSGEEQKAIRESDDFQNMGCWPATDSVQQKGNVIVIKIAGQ